MNFSNYLLQNDHMLVEFGTVGWVGNGRRRTIPSGRYREGSLGAQDPLAP